MYVVIVIKNTEEDKTALPYLFLSSATITFLLLTVPLTLVMDFFYGPAKLLWILGLAAATIILFMATIFHMRLPMV
jgi:hypothetical protein